jgi:hypothetical protein
VCTTPVDGYERCFRCQQQHTIAGVAELVAPLTYAVERAQSGILLRHYKDDVSPAARAQHAAVIRRLLYVGIIRHERCIGRRVGQPVSLRVTVPSLSRRPGVHPFAAIAAALRAVDDGRLALAASPRAVAGRVVSAAQFQVVPPRSLAGQHVLILDDTWTTGANTQSAALTLRAAGARRVSVMVVGRWLSPTYGHNAEFVRTRLRGDYDPGRCPVTGGACP